MSATRAPAKPNNRAAVQPPMLAPTTTTSNPVRTVSELCRSANGVRRVATTARRRRRTKKTCQVRRARQESATSVRGRHMPLASRGTRSTVLRGGGPPIWRMACQAGSSFDRSMIRADETLAARHEREVQSLRGRCQTHIRGLVTSRPSIRRGSPSKDGRGRPKPVAHGGIASLSATLPDPPGARARPGNASGAMVGW